MILLAICDSVRGVFVPVLQNEFSINNTKIGIMIFVSTLGYSIFTYLGGLFCEKIGQKKVYIIGFMIIFISLLLISFSPNYLVLLLGMFLINTGQAFIAIATNTIIPIVFLSIEVIIMNIAHFSYGIGSAISQRIAGILLYSGISWRKIYFYIAIITLFQLIIIIFTKIPNLYKLEQNKKIKNKKIFKDKIIYLYIFALGFYVFSEIATGNWFVNFIEKTYHFNKSQSSYYISLFFTVFAVGRLAGGFLLQRLNYLKTVSVSLSMALIMYTFGIFLGVKGLMLISLSGLFFSITFPTIVLTVSKVYTENSSYVTGIVVTFASFINMILNLFMGFLNDKLGIYLTYYMIPISLSFSLIFVLLIYKNTNKLNVK
ncbi:MFS transporter [Clostridium niameyense]|uniref:MFS transporter n=2 Tax=Clostridium niameyense TaxID=1622073 RepID=A0A6M0RCG0_9CLOT|nr:MFS transporter [Clostridium niameyense]